MNNKKQLLFRYHWLYSATAYNHAYADTGLFCIHASSTPSHVKEMAEVIVHELVAMAGNVSETELAVSSLLYNHESDIIYIFH